MAIYHLTAKMIQRSQGQSSAGSSAYCSASLLVDHTTPVGDSRGDQSPSREAEAYALEAAKPARDELQRVRNDAWTRIAQDTGRASADVADLQQFVQAAYAREIAIREFEEFKKTERLGESGNRDHVKSGRGHRGSFAPQLIG